MAIDRGDFPLPDVDDPIVAPFFAAAARGELRVTGCDDCDRLVWYPPESCPTCGAELTWRAVSGNASLFSWVVVRRPFLPAFAEMVPFVTALVALTEDPSVRLCTFVPDVNPATLYADQPMVVEFRPLRFPTVPGREAIVPMFVPD
jgi:uncharacterized protein